MLKKILARNIKKLRETKGLTQLKLAELSGLSYDGFQKIELATRWPTSKSIEAIAKALKVHPTRLFEK